MRIKNKCFVQRFAFHKKRNKYFDFEIQVYGNHLFPYYIPTVYFKFYNKSTANRRHRIIMRIADPHDYIRCITIMDVRYG